MSVGGQFNVAKALDFFAFGLIVGGSCANCLSLTLYFKSTGVYLDWQQVEATELFTFDGLGS